MTVLEETYTFTISFNTAHHVHYTRFCILFAYHDKYVQHEVRMETAFSAKFGIQMKEDWAGTGSMRIRKSSYLFAE